jgi:Zn-dependent peptidase ImmA (M78 family)/transcriptional regulator with XRE-family HTH domain
MSRPTTKEFFVKERLTEAREARGLTQSVLAQALGKSASTISNWERGEQSPEPASLEMLSRDLRLPTRYFLKQMPSYGSEAIFFRSLSNATARVRSREKARMRWLQHISITLQNTLDFPRLDVFSLPKNDYKKLSHDDLENIASEVRARWQLGDGPIANMLLVAENAGVVVGIDEVGSTSIDGQANWCDVDGRPYILLTRDKYTAFRRQMDIAHELAHIILHHGVTEEKLQNDFEIIEDQAKYFAGALLLPHKSFSSEVYSLSLDGFLSLKPKWKVAVGAMIMRALQLELLSDTAAQRLWKYRATRGWHKKEPLDLPTETPIEEPRLLRRSIELIVSAKVMSKLDLLNYELCLADDDVELLASLPAHYFAEKLRVLHFEPKLKTSLAIEGGAAILPMKRPT